MRSTEIRRAEAVLGRKLIRQRRDYNRLLGGSDVDDIVEAMERLRLENCEAIETIPYRGRFGNKDVRQYFREEYDRWSRQKTISPADWDEYKTFYDRFVKISKRYESHQRVSERCEEAAAKVY